MNENISTPSLVVKDLYAGYGDINALHGVSLEVSAGEGVALVGPNGAGKSTLFKRIAGLIRGGKGGISWDGQDISALPIYEFARLGIRYVPEERRIFGHLSVWENLEVAALSLGIRGRERIEAMDSAARYFPILAQRRNQPAGLLSGGQQQMLAIARALIGRPKILLLDEVSLGLAPVVIHEVGLALRELLVNEGVGILLAEQNAGLAFDVCSRGYVLSLGEIHRSGTADELRSGDALASEYL